MTEVIQRAVHVWNTMQRDPAMLSGLTMGQLEDLAEGVAALVNDVAVVRRSIPLALMLDFGKLSTATVEETLTFMREMLSLKPLRTELDKRAAK